MVNKLNLVNTIVGLLQHHKISEDKINQFRSDSTIVAIKNNDIDDQRIILVRYWYYQIQLNSLHNANTLGLRYILMGDTDIDTWLKLFEDKIIPYIIKFELPK